MSPSGSCHWCQQWVDLLPVSVSGSVRMPHAASATWCASSAQCNFQEAPSQLLYASCRPWLRLHFRLTQRAQRAARALSCPWLSAHGHSLYRLGRYPSARNANQRQSGTMKIKDGQGKIRASFFLLGGARGPRPGMPGPEGQACQGQGRDPKVRRRATKQLRCQGQIGLYNFKKCKQTARPVLFFRRPATYKIPPSNDIPNFLRSRNDVLQYTVYS